MEQLTLDDLYAEAKDFDGEVDRTTGIDHVCSSSDWVVPAYRSWGRDSEPLILRSSRGWTTLCERRDVDGLVYLCPPEAIWGFGAPVVGSHPKALARELAVAMQRRPTWQVTLLTGLATDSPLDQALTTELGRLHRLRRGPVITRCHADLSDGVEALLSRRAPKWRKNVKTAWRKAADAGVEIVNAPSNLRAAFSRLMEVETRSWKGRSGGGLIAGDLRRFYRELTHRVGPTGRLRFAFARLDDRDVGYILGHVRNSTYRGLQISFDDDHRDLSVGTILQLHQLQLLAEEGITTYDLGMDMAYKRRWADHFVTTGTLVVIRR